MAKVSVVIPWCDRAEFSIACHRNAELLSGEEVEVVVVNCGGDSSRLRSYLSAAPLPAVDVIDLPHRPFSKSFALNVGALASEAPLLLFLDCDIVLPSDTLDQLCAAASSECFATVAWVSEAVSAPSSNESLLEIKQYLELTWANGPQRVLTEFHRSRGDDGARGGPGIICMMKEHFFEAKGMNAALGGWGWEDHDLIIRLIAALGLRRVCCGEVEHLQHRAAEQEANKSERFQNLRRNMAICQKNYEARRFLGTLDEDRVAWRHMQQHHTTESAAGAKP